MNYVYFFQHNIKKENQLSGRTDRYINIMAEWDGMISTYDGSPIVIAQPVNLQFGDCISVKDWYALYNEVRKIAEDHFKELARQERINKARAELIAEGEIIENPVLQRYETLTPVQIVNDLIEG